ncbi:hypothetical protein V1511DRAFT_497657 [Dipodascopsis uninucleata]
MQFSSSLRRLAQLHVGKSVRMARRYIDIGANLTDPMFRGIYHGKRSHEDDFEDILQRARDQGVQKMLVTGSDLKESKEAIHLAKSNVGMLFATVGVHPCSSLRFEESGDPERYLEEIEILAREGKEEGTVMAFGEIGLDYARLHYAPADVQRKYFEKQLDIAIKLQLPLFLHSRDCAADFEMLLFPRLQSLPRGGVVHSFTGTVEEMQGLVAKGLYIGVNGCSLKTEENLSVIKNIPLDRLLLETDAPWCEIRPTHASHKFLADERGNDIKSLPKAVKKEKFKKGDMIKGRCEPCAISQVAVVIAKLKNITVDELCEKVWDNSVRLFGFNIKVSDI